MAVEFDFEIILRSLKRAAGALRDAGVPFALGGGLAVWARGGARTEHDVDFFVKREDAERAQEALVAAGLEPETPPEGWLLKAWDGNVLVDLIFEPRGGPVDDELLERAEEFDVYAVTMRVASLDDVLVTKLLALSEQNLDYSDVLEMARAVASEALLHGNGREACSEQRAGLVARRTVARHEQHRRAPRSAEGRVDPRLADERAVEPQVLPLLARDRVVEDAVARPVH